VYHSTGQAGYVYYWSLPGYPNIYFTSYTFSLTSDPTAGMKLVIAADGPKMSASGTCRYTLTVDGGKKYYFKGTWKGTLDVTGGVMTFYDLDVRKCLDSKG
jgi:inosine/xanthosine triphosphate pyrophosphatase family protein